MTTLIGLLIISSCVKQEKYSEIPEISLRPFVLIFDMGQYAVKGVLSFDFQDGNGDIGLNPGDTFPPFNRDGDYYYNLVIRYFEKQDSIYVEVVLDPPFSARIPVLNPDYPGKAIKGFVSDTLAMDPAPAFDTVRFEFFIYDRDLNKSNVLTTTDIPLRK
ncbi:MAG: hypothetical protein ISS17_10435 [Bacteroidales bacterium]|nr:hypothetical protein [Bacteroidales bacterium]